MDTIPAAFRATAASLPRRPGLGDARRQQHKCDGNTSLIGSQLSLRVVDVSHTLWERLDHCTTFIYVILLKFT
jgi:hypothetical protein